jgi:multiple sugar transport system permease protein
MVVALSLALLLNCRVHGTAIFRTIFYLPSIVPIIASSMLWLWILNPSFGLINQVLAPFCHLLGTRPPGWLSDPAWAKPALILMSAWGVGNSMIIYLAGLQDVPESLYEAAEIDGAGKWQQFWHVTLPMLMPVIYFNLVMGIIGALQVFTQVFIMTDGTNGAPAQSTLMYTPYLFSVAFFDFRMGYACAMAWVLFCIIALLTFFATRVLAKRINYAR